MFDINSVIDAFGVICDPDHHAGFKHVATAWHLGDGDWVSAYTPPSPLPDSLVLLVVTTGAVEAISNCEVENKLLGFQSVSVSSKLNVASDESALQKRDEISVIGYPSVIDHPAFSLHRGSLSAKRYYPYLCPWKLDGHLSLFSADDGFITGKFYYGMQGAPVFNQQRDVVGIVLDGSDGKRAPSLTRFRRLA